MRRDARAASTEPPHTRGRSSPIVNARSFAGFVASVWWGEHDSATASIASATRSMCTSGPSPTRLSPSRTTMAAASGSPVRSGMIVVDGPSACSATGEPSGHATMTRAPLRTASAIVPLTSGSYVLSVSTMTRSSGPTHAGSACIGQATNGTGQDGSSTARISRASGPDAITARGRYRSPRSPSVDRSACPASMRSRAPACARCLSGASMPAKASGSSSRESSNTAHSSSSRATTWVSSSADASEGTSTRR